VILSIQLGSPVYPTVLYTWNTKGHLTVCTLRPSWSPDDSKRKKERNKQTNTAF